MNKTKISTAKSTNENTLSGSLNIKLKLFNSPKNELETHQLNWRVIVLITLFVGLLYGPIIQYDFVNLDDTTMLEKHSGVKTFNLANIWGNSHLAMYTPVTYTVLSIVAQLTPQRPTFNAVNDFIKDLDPLGFHLLGLFLHIGNCILVYMLFQRLIKNSKSAFLGSLLFAVHPLQIESVAWIASTRELLMTMFSLAAIVYFYDHWLEDKINLKSFATLSFLIITAMLSKPTAIILPPLLFLWLYAIERKNWTDAIFFLLPTIFISIILLVSIKSLQTEESLPFQLSFWQRPIVALDAFTFYLRKFLVPTNLSADYGRNPIFLFQSPEVSWTWAPAILICLLLVWFWKKMQWNYRAFVLIAVVPFFPISGLQGFTFQHVSTVADRYFYLPSVGLIGLLTLTLSNWQKDNMLISRAKWATAVAALCIWTWMTWNQIGIWKNSETLWTRVTQVNPQSWLAFNNWASYYEAKKDFNRAIPLYQKSLNYHPDSMTWARVGIMHYELGKKIDALTCFENALKLNPNNALALQNAEVVRKELQTTTK